MKPLKPQAHLTLVKSDDFGFKKKNNFPYFWPKSSIVAIFGWASYCSGRGGGRGVIDHLLMTTVHSWYGIAHVVIIA